MKEMRVSGKDLYISAPVGSIERKESIEGKERKESIPTYGRAMNALFHEDIKETSFKEQWEKADIQARMRILYTMGKSRSTFFAQLPENERKEILDYINTRKEAKESILYNTLAIVYDLSIKSSLDVILVMAFVDPYCTRILNKFEKYDIGKVMKFTAKRYVNQFKQQAKDLQRYTLQIDCNSIALCFSNELSYYFNEYDCGVFTQSAQFVIEKKWHKLISDLYMKVRNIAEGMNEKYADLVGHLFVVYLLMQVIDAMTIINDRKTNNALKQMHEQQAKLYEEDGVLVDKYEPSKFGYRKRICDMMQTTEILIERISGKPIPVEQMGSTKKPIAKLMEILESNETLNTLSDVIEESALHYQKFYVAKLVQNEITGTAHPDEVKTEVKYIIGNFGWCRLVKDLKTLARLIVSNDVLDIMDDIETIKSKGIKVPAYDMLLQYVGEIRQGKRTLNKPLPTKNKECYYDHLLQRLSAV